MLLHTEGFPFLWLSSIPMCACVCAHTYNPRYGSYFPKVTIMECSQEGNRTVFCVHILSCHCLFLIERLILRGRVTE